METAVAKISTQVCTNEDSLKQVLEGQNQISQLLMRFLNSESGNQGNTITVPASLQSLCEHGRESLPSSLPVGTSSPILISEAVVGNGTSSPIEDDNHTVVDTPGSDASLHAQERSSIHVRPGREEPEGINSSTPGRHTGLDPEVEQAPTGAVAGTTSPPSWMSGSTILITPSMDLRGLPRRGPRSPSAMSTDISDSIRTPSVIEEPGSRFLDIYLGGGWRESPQNVNASQSSPSGCSPAAPPTFTDEPRVHTRQQSNTSDEEVARRGKNAERIRHGLMMLPRISEEPIACNKPCYILHPDFPDTVVAEGKSGGSWKAKTQKLGHLCSKTEQMVQVHVIKLQNCRLLNVEERQPFKTLDDAVVKRSGSNVFVKWSTRYLVRIIDSNHS